MRRIMIALATLGVTFPAHAQICTPFTDVLASSAFCGNIQWIYNRGITLGCTANQFCPSQFVRRDQMAAFLYRLGFQNAFLRGGNAFGATTVLGTTDNQALEMRANGARVMRYEPNAISPNVIGGNPANLVTAGVRGATISGGGVPPGDVDPDFCCETPHRVTDAYGTIAGGYANLAGNSAGTTIDAAFATVGGGIGNAASSAYSTVGGGVRNLATGDHSTVPGGRDNNAAGTASTVGGGVDNGATNSYSTVAGGADNVASGVFSTITGGTLNIATTNSSTVGGGFGNKAFGEASTVAGGNTNTTSGINSTVSGGKFNTASGDWSTVAGGDGGTAGGHYSTVPGGSDNWASGDYSFAAGRRARAGTGSFSFADSNNLDFHSIALNQFRVRATGGVRFVTDIDGSGGIVWQCVTSAGSGWSCASDRNHKQNLRRLDGQAVLERLLAMPVYAWNPKGRNAHVNHYGPTAQDFHAAFGLGDDDTMIGAQDADGVALAAIQGLNAKLEIKIAEQVRELDQQRSEIAGLRAALAQLLARLTPVGDVAALR